MPEAPHVTLPAAPDPAHAEWALRERVKELTCLYGIAQVIERAGADLERALGGIVALLPPAWQYPEHATARIVLDERAWDTGVAAAPADRQSAEITVNGQPRGRVEVGYRVTLPAADEGPFLAEERALIQEVARRIGELCARREETAERERLRELLWRSERLGTVGQLAAGLAHELNEPLGTILGYAQLASRSFGLPDQTGRDLDKVVRASLHARDIVRRLLLFARETSFVHQPVDLGELVRGSLFLLESRCRRAGVRIVLQLADEVPEVSGNRSLLAQAFLNIAFNGILAMPGGGRLTVSSATVPAGVRLSVEDTGSGMTPEVLAHCFEPFYTTREIGEGTGLGLAVAHGIVSSHHGTLEATSTPGAGSRFTITLPVTPPADAGATDATR